MFGRPNLTTGIKLSIWAYFLSIAKILIFIVTMMICVTGEVELAFDELKDFSFPLWSIILVAAVEIFSIWFNGRTLVANINDLIMLKKKGKSLFCPVLGLVILSMAMVFSVFGFIVNWIYSIISTVITVCVLLLMVVFPGVHLLPEVIMVFRKY